MKIAEKIQVNNRVIAFNSEMIARLGDILKSLPQGDASNEAWERIDELVKTLQNGIESMLEHNDTLLNQ